MNKADFDDLEKLLNGPEWLIPLMQDIAADKVTREDIDDVFDYMQVKKLEDVICKLYRQEESKGENGKFEQILERAESLCSRPFPN